MRNEIELLMLMKKGKTVISDTILVRIDTEELLKTLENRPEINDKNKTRILEKIVSSLQNEIEKEVQEFSTGNGHFESCLYDAI